MHESQISRQVIGCATAVHRHLGPGLLEPVYEESLCFELGRAKLSYERQKNVPIRYKNVTLRTPLRLDLLIEKEVIVAVKAQVVVSRVDLQTLLTCLRLCNIRLGLLINFYEAKLVNGVHRITNGLTEA